MEMVLPEITTGLNESSGMGSHIVLASSGDQRRQSLLSALCRQRRNQVKTQLFTNKQKGYQILTR